MQRACQRRHCRRWARKAVMPRHLETGTRSACWIPSRRARRSLDATAMNALPFSGDDETPQGRSEGWQGIGE
jgi:hypothetical protein